jgi:hypothetical protein
MTETPGLKHFRRTDPVDEIRIDLLRAILKGSGRDWVKTHHKMCAQMLPSVIHGLVLYDIACLAIAFAKTHHGQDCNVPVSFDPAIPKLERQAAAALANMTIRQIFGKAAAGTGLIHSTLASLDPAGWCPGQWRVLDQLIQIAQDLLAQIPKRTAIRYYQATA